MNAARIVSSVSTSLLFALALLGGVSTVRAQSDDDYRAAMHDGEAELEAQHYPEARALFRRARGMHDDSRALVRLGQTEFEMREYVDCVRHLRAALADTVHPVHAAREPVTALLARARAFVGEYRLEIQPASATLTVDDEPRPTTEPLLLAIGAHALVLRADGHEELRRTVHTEGGEDEALTLALTASTASASTTGATGTTSSTGATTSSVAVVEEPARHAGGNTPPPPTGPMVRVHIESTSPGLVLQRASGTSFDGFTQFTPVCAAPCDAEVPAGNTTLGVSSGSGSAQLANHSVFTFQHDTSVRISYESRDALRLAGGIGGATLLLGGLFLVVGGFASAQHGVLADDNVAIMGIGGAVATVGLVVGLALLLLSDIADVELVAAQ